VGGRDFDDDRFKEAGKARLNRSEPALLQTAGVRVVSEADMRKAGLAGALTPALDALAAEVQRVYVHIDLDVIDPAEAQANQYAPDGGLSVDEVATAIGLTRSGQRLPVVGASFTAYDPDYDPDGRMLQAGLRLMEAVVQ
jgi:arginase